MSNLFGNHKISDKPFKSKKMPKIKIPMDSETLTIVSYKRGYDTTGQR
jgi:hypothetical protein